MNEDAPPRRPGHNAGREHERRRAARERRDPGSSAPAHEDAWRKGQEGEEILGLRLNAGAQKYGGAVVLHDLTPPGKRGNLDYVVIGPAGVTIVDAKAWSGRLQAELGEIRQGGRRRQQVVGGMRRQVHAVCAVLAAAGRDDVPVSGVICFMNDNEGLPPSSLAEFEGIPVGCTDPCVRYAMRDGPLDVEAVGALAVLISRSFEVDGGAFGPAHRVRAPASVFVIEQPSTPPPVRVPVPRPTERRRPGAPAGRRAAARGRRRSRGVGFDLFKLVVLLAVLFSVLSKMGTDSRSASLSRVELNAAGPQMRAQAVGLAGRAVRGPRVISRPEEFVMTYTGAEGCLVRARVDRALGAAALEAPAWQRRGCGS